MENIEKVENQENEKVENQENLINKNSYEYNHNRLKLIIENGVSKIIDLKSSWELILEYDFVNKCGKNYHNEKNKVNMIKFYQDNKKVRYISESKVHNGFLLDYTIENENENKKSYNKKSKIIENWNWLDYVKSEEEKEVIKKYNDLKDLCIKRHDLFINDPQTQLKFEQLNKIINFLNDDDLMIFVSDDKKIELIKKYQELSKELYQPIDENLINK